MKKVIILIMIGFIFAGNAFAEPAEKHFDLTFDEFISRYNEAMRTISQPLRMTKETEESAEDIITMTGMINKNLGLVGIANKKNKKMTGFIFIGSGDGTELSGLNILLGMVAAVMAIEDPFLPRSERGKLIIMIGKVIKKGTIEFIRKNTKYNYAYSKVTGAMFSAEPN